MSGHDNPIAGHAQNSCSRVGASAGLVQLKKFSAKWSAPGGRLADRAWRLAELRDVVRRQLQDLACQMAVGEPKFIQNREVIRLCDRYQVAGEMRLRPVSMIIPAGRDHRRQLARAIRDGKRLVDA